MYKFSPADAQTEYLRDLEGVLQHETPHLLPVTPAMNREANRCWHLRLTVRHAFVRLSGTL